MGDQLDRQVYGSAIEGGRATRGAAVPGRPFGTGLFLRSIDGRLQGMLGQWG